MRIPHYLTRAPSGRYTFRLLIPRHLRDTLGRKVIKHSLRTTDLATARATALVLASRYARIFGGHSMAGKKLEELLASAQGARRGDYEITPTAFGFSLKADGEEDHARMMEALAIAGRMPATTPAIAQKQVVEVLTLGKARDLYLASIKVSTIPKTYSIKRTAVNSFVRFVGEKTALHTITRPDMSRWYQSLRDSGIATPTIINKQSYLGGEKGFFAWTIASGYYAEDNPASGHNSYSVKEKRQRRKLGFKAFTVEQVRALFAPVAFANLSYHARWAALIGLYTGARASEVGQLLVADIIISDGIQCFNITDEGENQRLKSEVSIRVVSIHADLIELGFNDYVSSLTGARLFPNGKADAINGAGNWISKAFSAHVKEVGGKWEKSKRGFHSLRKTVIQEMQTAKVSDELRAQIVGHELDDEHHTTYSRKFTSKEKRAGLKKLNYGLPLADLFPLVAISESKRIR